MKITFKHFREIVEAIEVVDISVDDKFSYACKKVLMQAKKIFSEIAKERNEYLEDKRVELASVDEKGNIVYDLIGKDEKQVRIPKLTPGNALKLNSEMRNLISKQDEKEIEVNPHLCTDESYERATEEVQEILKGICIP